MLWRHSDWSSCHRWVGLLNDNFSCGRQVRRGWTQHTVASNVVSSAKRCLAIATGDTAMPTDDVRKGRIRSRRLRAWRQRSSRAFASLDATVSSNGEFSPEARWTNSLSVRGSSCGRTCCWTPASNSIRFVAASCTTPREAISKGSHRPATVDNLVCQRWAWAFGGGTEGRALPLNRGCLYEGISGGGAILCRSCKAPSAAPGSSVILLRRLSSSMEAGRRTSAAGRGAGRVRRRDETRQDGHRHRSIRPPTQRLLKGSGPVRGRRDRASAIRSRQRFGPEANSNFRCLGTVRSEGWNTSSSVRSSISTCRGTHAHGAAHRNVSASRRGTLRCGLPICAIAALWKTIVPGCWLLSPLKAI